MDRWWVGKAKEYRLVNGVFKGGGARGIAYLGALRAVEATGLWFKSVAGSSAGALTATLIAAGLHPDDMPAASDKLLQAIRHPRNFSPLLRSGSGGVLSTRMLGEAIEEVLRAKVAREDSALAPVTFSELAKASSIELFIVTMDLATRRPIVFCSGLTSESGVADAVVASCSIPLVFAPRRVTLINHHHQVHQLVDGGAWANYPMFVYRDEEFRSWMASQTAAAESAEPSVAGETIGFVLDDSLRVPAPGLVQFLGGRAGDVSFDLGPGQTSTRLPISLAFRLMGGWFARIVLLAVLVAWFILGLSTLPRLLHGLDAWTFGRMPTSLQPVVSLGVCALFLATAIGLASLILVIAILGPAISRTLLPSVGAALSPATAVPPWVGSSEETLVLSVPARRLKTLSFFAGSQRRLATMQDACTESLKQLQAWSDSPASEIDEPTDDSAKTLAQLRRRPRGLVLFLTAIAVALLLGVVAQAVVADFADGDGRWGWRGLAAIVLCLTVIVYWVSRASDLANKRSLVRPGSGPWPGSRRALACAVGGAILLILAFLTAAVLPDENPTSKVVVVAGALTSVDERVQAVLQEGEVPPPTYIYDFDVVDGADPIDSVHFLFSNERLLTGQRLTVEWVPEQAATVPLLRSEARSSALGDESSLPLMLAGAGILLLLSANQFRKWRVGSRRLGLLP